MRNDENGGARPSSGGCFEYVLSPLPNAVAVLATGRTKLPSLPRQTGQQIRDFLLELDDRPTRLATPVLFPQTGLAGDGNIEKAVQNGGGRPGPAKITADTLVPPAGLEQMSPRFRLPSSGCRQAGIELALDTFFAVPDGFGVPYEAETGCFFLSCHLNNRWWFGRPTRPVPAIRLSSFSTSV